jgi:hypothetical protein
LTCISRSLSTDYADGEKKKQQSPQITRIAQMEEEEEETA